MPPAHGVRTESPTQCHTLALAENGPNSSPDKDDFEIPGPLGGRREREASFPREGRGLSHTPRDPVGRLILFFEGPMALYND